MQRKEKKKEKKRKKKRKEKQDLEMLIRLVVIRSGCIKMEEAAAAVFGIELVTTTCSAHFFLFRLKQIWAWLIRHRSTADVG